MNPYVTAVLGAGAGFGVFMIAYGLFFYPATDPEPDREGRSNHASSNRPRTWPRLRGQAMRAAAAVLAGALAWWWTGWPVAGAATGLLIWYAKTVFGDDTAGKSAVAKVEAVTDWIESVRDVVAAGAGLGQALTKVAGLGVPGLETETAALTRSISDGVSPETALRTFARDVDDQTADDAVIALIRAQRRSGDLAGLLNRLAATAREDAAMRTRVIASRARVRTAARLITITAIAEFAIVVAARPDFLDVYNGPFGQVLLAAVLAVFALSLHWLVRLGRWQRPPRLIDLGSLR